MSGSATTASATDTGAALTCSMGAISGTRMLFLTRLLCCSACINVSGEPRLRDIQRVVLTGLLQFRGLRCDGGR